MKALIVDDHPGYRRSLIETLRLIDDSIDVVEAGSDEVVASAIAEHAPQLVLLDLYLKDAHTQSEMEAVAWLRELRQQHPQLVMVVVSGENDPRKIRRVLEVGLQGFISKREEPRIIHQALKLVMEGGIYIPPQATSDFVHGRPPPETGDATGLTPRQHDVARLLYLSEKEIGRVLGIEEGTVGAHVGVILQKLYAKNKAHAALLYREMMGDAWEPGPGFGPAGGAAHAQRGRR
jgi:DNA-binding NarL/FixJ family response regulator